MTQSLISPFVDASKLLRPNDDALNYGCVMADFDQDGLPEILVVTVNGPNRLYKWDDSRLIDVAPPELQDIEANGIGVACGDFSGNGRLDVYLLNTTAFLGPNSDPDRLLINKGGLQFEDEFATNPARNVAAGRSVAFLDLKGDFNYHIYVCNYAVPCRLYGRNEIGQIVDLAPELGLDQVTGGRSVVTGDFFGSGRVDIFTANESDSNRFFKQQEDGTFLEIAGILGLRDSGCHARGLAVCDFNRDGLIDFIWGNWEGPHRIMKQTPGRGFVNVASDAFARPSRVRTVIVFDYDNDGWEDIFVNNIGEPNRLFHNNGDGSFTEVDPGPLALPDGLGTGATVGDLNGDGFLDIFISHGESDMMPNALFLNAPNGNNWLRVHALSPAGAPALGTRVTLYAEGDSRPMIRFINGGSGYLCQMEPVAHFGLAQAAQADRIEIRFTNGATCLLREIAACSNVYVRPKGDDFDVQIVADGE